MSQKSSKDARYRLGMGVVVGFLIFSAFRACQNNEPEPQPLPPRVFYAAGRDDITCPPNPPRGAPVCSVAPDANINIDETGQITLYGRVYTIAELRAFLEDSSVVIVEANPDCPDGVIEELSALCEGVFGMPLRKQT